MCIDKKGVVLRCVAARGVGLYIIHRVECVGNESGKNR